MSYTFSPDYAVPPGETLKEMLEDRRISQADLSHRTELTEKTISQIIKGVAPITYDTAEKLELVLGVSARFWNNRESQYREALLRMEHESRLGDETEWLKLIPVKELVKRGYVVSTSDKGQIVRQVLKFFGVSSVAAWDDVWLIPQIQFRGGSTHDNKPGYVATWVRMAELSAEHIDCQPYNAEKFKKAIQIVRSLTILPSTKWLPKVRELFHEAGVVFVLEKEIPSASVSGVTKWLGKDKALIALSLKYKRDDQFWFSFFHECCHVLKHGKKIVFYEQGGMESDPLEDEANKYAADVLIPPEYAAKLPYLQRRRDHIRAFASQIGVAPGIVLGRMQHDGLIPPSWCHDLKKIFDWANE
jgi:HTH-type transcriptional regulator / antitoxin HigA